MHKTTLAMVLFLGALPAVTACSGAPDGSTDPTADTTSAATAAPRATITGPVGTWSPRLFEDQVRGTLLPSVEIDLASSRRSYVLSDAVVTSFHSNGATETFTLTFKYLSVPKSAAAVRNPASTWVTIAGVGSFPVDSVEL
jgi:hypothetical protein